MYTLEKQINNQYNAIPLIVDNIVNAISPYKIILFGSCARRYITYHSDIDICIVLDEKLGKQEKLKIKMLLLERLVEIIDYDIDLLIYTKEEWEGNRNNPATFIGKIFREGEILYGG